MDVTKLAIEKTNNCEKIVAFHQQAFQTFNQCLLQLQNLSSTSVAANAIAKDLASLEVKGAAAALTLN
jgi:hypothetical protein